MFQQEKFKGFGKFAKESHCWELSPAPSCFCEEVLDFVLLINIIYLMTLNQVQEDSSLGELEVE